MKKNINFTYILIFIILFGSISILSAQSKYAQAGMTFLKIGVGARTAMGGAQLGIVGDCRHQTLRFWCCL